LVEHDIPRPINYDSALRVAVRCGAQNWYESLLPSPLVVRTTHLHLFSAVMQTYLALAVAVAVFWFVKLYLGWRATVSSVRNYPGLRYVFGPESFTIQWRIPYLAAGNFSLWTQKHKDFAQFDSDVISSVRTYDSSICAAIVCVLGKALENVLVMANHCLLCPDCICQTQESLMLHFVSGHGAIRI